MGDLILGVLLLLAAYYGWHKGVIKIIGGIGAVIGGIFIARRLTPLLMPWLEETLGQAVSQAPVAEPGSSSIFTSLFVSETQLGRLIELIVFLVVVCIITWLLRKLANFLGNVINMTPLVGFISRVLGLVLAVCAWSVVIYACDIWLLPWLASLIQPVEQVIAVLDSSKYVLPLIQALGFEVWYLAAGSVMALEQLTP